MSKLLQWAIGGLALLIVGFVALQIYIYVNMQRFKEELAGPEPKTETETEQPSEQVQVPEVDNRPPHPDDGRVYEWHGDRWDPVDGLSKGTHENDPETLTQKSPYVVKSRTALNAMGIDTSFLDNPEESIRKFAEIVLNPERYTNWEVSTAHNNARLLKTQILYKDYYGDGERKDALLELYDEVYMGPLLKIFGTSIEEIKSQVPNLYEQSRQETIERVNREFGVTVDTAEGEDK